MTKTNEFWKQKFDEEYGEHIKNSMVTSDGTHITNPGHTLKKLMEAHGVNNEALAKKAGIHVNTVQGYTSGKHSPTLLNFLACLNALGYTLKIDKM